MVKRKKNLWVFMLLISILPAQAQQENNQSDFDALFDFKATPYRSALGEPGPQYWQNRADYVINVELNDQNHQITGKVKIIYTNNSPDPLGYLWLQLDQNKFKEDSRGTLVQDVAGSRNSSSTTTGYDIKSVKIAGQDAKFIVNDTRMQIRLDNPLKAKGGKIEVEIDYNFIIPEYGSDRMGRYKTEKGWVYSIAQWYPRMCVYDDIKGWNVEPYLGKGEFYLEYGNIDYKVTTSNKIVVLGSGQLQNPAQCYTTEQQARWEKAKNSDLTVPIIAQAEVGTPNARPAGSNGKITWHFKIENTRDAAFGASEAFIVDAARINLPSGKKSLAISGYSQESVGKDGWERSTEFSKASIEHYSKMWYEYPYATANNCASICGGMEYPGVNFCKWTDKGEELWGVTDHEFGHNWFPMIVGSNERLYPWMDEGFNTFINHYSTKEFNKGEYFDPNGFVIDNVHRKELVQYVLQAPNRESISTYPDIVQDRNLGVTAYFKPAMGLLLLREYILGPERFDYAFRNYIKTWAYKHPQPFDFFNAMENASGEDLDWFWKKWIYGTGNIDIAVGGVTEQKGEYIFSLINKGEIPIPVEVQLTDASGRVFRMDLPVEIWHNGDAKSIKAGKNKITKIIIDPDKQIPDVNLANNEWSLEMQQKKEKEEAAKAAEEAKKAQEQQAQAEQQEEEGKKKKKKKNK